MKFSSSVKIGFLKKKKIAMREKLDVLLLPNQIKPCVLDIIIITNQPSKTKQTQMFLKKATKHKKSNQTQMFLKKAAKHKCSSKKQLNTNVPQKKTTKPHYLLILSRSLKHMNSKKKKNQIKLAEPAPPSFATIFFTFSLSQYLKKKKKKEQNKTKQKYKFQKKGGRRLLPLIEQLDAILICLFSDSVILLRRCNNFHSSTPSVLVT